MNIGTCCYLFSIYDYYKNSPTWYQPACPVDFFSLLRFSFFSFSVSHPLPPPFVLRASFYHRPLYFPQQHKKVQNPALRHSQDRYHAKVTLRSCILRFHFPLKVCKSVVDKVERAPLRFITSSLLLGGSCPSY